MPALHVLTPEVAAHLQSHVAGGGTLVVTPRTGVKDASDVVVNQPLPGLLAEVCGVSVGVRRDSPTAAQAVIFEGGELAGQTLPVQTWCDILKPQGAEVLAHYAQDYYAGRPAITRNRFGQGHAIYMGAFGSESLYDSFFDWLLKQSGIQNDTVAPAAWKLRSAGAGIMPFVLY